MQSISMIGIGRMGGALTLALSRAGYNVTELIYRTGTGVSEIASGISAKPDLVRFGEIRNLSSDIIFITSADPEIADIASRIKPLIGGSPFIFHASGSLDSGVLAELAASGCETGSIHPLVSISDPVRGCDRFSGAYFCIEGSEKAVKLAKTIVANLGGVPFSIDSKFKALYHASAVTVSGHLVALVDAAIEMLSQCGVSADKATRILLPLVKSTVENLGEQSTSDALTGSYSRADAEAFERHMNALDNFSTSDIRRIFLELALRSSRLAEGRSDRSGDFKHMSESIRIALETAR